MGDGITRFEMGSTGELRTDMGFSNLLTPQQVSKRR